jgi:curli production assembly/transport component CsgG
MLYAGMLVEGGIVGYDANTLSGGDGVRVFGIGVSEKYTKHTVTVAIRAISVATSEVLASILVEKEILSITDNLTATKFFDLDRKVIEIESGTTTNEASNYAVRSAVNKAVHELVLEGLSNKLW